MMQGSYERNRMSHIDLHVPGTLTSWRHRIPGTIFNSGVALLGAVGLGAFSLAVASLLTTGEVAQVVHAPWILGNEWPMVALGAAWGVMFGTLLGRVDGSMPARHIEFDSSQPLEIAMDTLRTFLESQPHTGATVRIRKGAGRTNRYLLRARMPRSDDPTGRDLYERLEALGFDVWHAPTLLDLQRA
jgi:hypothetical protein